MKKWIEELKSQPWSKAKKANDQPAFNWALNKTAGQVCSICLSSLFHSPFPSKILFLGKFSHLDISVKAKAQKACVDFMPRMKINSLEFLLYWSSLHNLVDLVVQNMFLDGTHEGLPSNSSVKYTSIVFDRMYGHLQ